MAIQRTAGLNIKVLEDQEVLMHFGDNPTIDRATGTFLEGWHSAGLEPAESAWGVNREVTSNATPLTGGQTATSYTAGAVTSTVEVIPGSPVVDHIEWPETVEQGGTLYRKHSSKVAKATIARVHKFASGIVHIQASREKADLTIAERTTTKDPTARSISINYENGDDEFIFEDMYYHVGEDGTVTQVESKIFKDVADVQSQIEAGTAFVPAASNNALEALVPVEDDGLVEFPGEEVPEDSEGDGAEA